MCWGDRIKPWAQILLFQAPWGWAGPQTERLGTTAAGSGAAATVHVPAVPSADAARGPVLPWGLLSLAWLLLVLFSCC